ncbi:unnamed protein product [Fusarium graminearum]|nr:unnamed protein product [Fusarium graminearum]
MSLRATTLCYHWYIRMEQAVSVDLFELDLDLDLTWSPSQGMRSKGGLYHAAPV